MAKRPIHIGTVKGSGSVKLPPKCDVDVWGVDPKDCECPKHKPKQPTFKKLESMFKF